MVLFNEINTKAPLSTILTPSRTLEPPEIKNPVIWEHFWVPLCNKPSRYRVRKKIPFITENGYYFNFEVNFLKRVHPYGGKNIFPQTFHLKGLWV